MTKEPRDYFSYLLRLWKVSGAGPPVWRASLEDVHTGERRGFADLEHLFTYLKEQTDGCDRDKRPRLHMV